ncbi:MAG: CAP domain-containing protein [Thermocrispum sp.]
MPDTPASTVQAVVDLVNQERADAGCDPVRADDRLNRAASKHSADMSARDYFSHDTPEGRDFAERIRAEGYPSPGAENIAQGYRSADAVMDGWMDSEGHRANILNCDLATIGVGLAKQDWVWTQDFGF